HQDHGEAGREADRRRRLRAVSHYCTSKRHVISGKFVVHEMSSVMSSSTGGFGGESSSSVNVFEARFERPLSRPAASTTEASKKMVVSSVTSTVSTALVASPTTDTIEASAA